jgi:hypothetical protein
LLLGGRLLLLLAGAIGVVVAIARSSDVHRAAYTCPMHPEVASPLAGDCPICGMALQMVAPSAARRTGGAVTLDKTDMHPFDVGPIVRRTLSVPIRAPASIDGGGVITALVYRSELDALAPDEQASFAASGPDPKIAVRRGPGAPRPWDDATDLVEFRADAGGPPLAPGTTGWVTVPAKPRPELVIPAIAVVWAGRSSSAFVASADGHTFTRRAIEIGPVYNGLGVVLAGLQAGERVAFGNAFLLDAEARLRSRGAGAAH